MSTTNFKIQGIVEEIKKTHAMVELHEKGGDPADEILAEQFRIRERKLMKELQAELVLLDFPFKSMALAEADNFEIWRDEFLKALACYLNQAFLEDEPEYNASDLLTTNPSFNSQIK